MVIKRVNLNELAYPLGVTAPGPNFTGLVAKKLIGRSIQERFIIFMYDDHGSIIGYSDINKGMTDTVIVDMHSSFRTALIAGAKSLCLCHNHPSGHMEFSNPDINITLSFIKAGKILGIEIKDHLLVSDSDVVSMRNSLGEMKWLIAQQTL